MPDAGELFQQLSEAKTEEDKVAIKVPVVCIHYSTLHCIDISVRIDYHRHCLLSTCAYGNNWQQVNMCFNKCMCITGSVQCRDFSVAPVDMK